MSDCTYPYCRCNITAEGPICERDGLADLRLRVNELKASQPQDADDLYMTINLAHSALVNNDTEEAKRILLHAIHAGVRRTVWRATTATVTEV